MACTTLRPGPVVIPQLPARDKATATAGAATTAEAPAAVVDAVAPVDPVVEPIAPERPKGRK
jgi:hypothetical protein